MKTVNKFLSKFYIAGIMLGVGFVALPVFAADNGCADNINNRVVPVLALCSAHTYNIGLPYNPTSDSDKQLMRSVVGLKSTIMMQQMYKQYEYLEATLSRLKTQLEREILTSKLTTAGASSSRTSSASGTYVGGNNGVAGAENCRSVGSTAEVMSCLSRNLDRISSAINSSDIGAARRQVETDLETMRLYDNLTPKDQTTSDKKYSSVSAQFASAYNECAGAGTNRQKLSSCVDYMRVFITRNIEAQNNQNRNTYNMSAR